MTPYERLAADKPGRELSPEGTIWQIYVEEAKEHDSELVEKENGNLDTMLLFAALFSAILTAFIIESKKLLEEDTSETTATLLLVIARSQQRIEQGIRQDFPLIERPKFVITMTARWINGLWFTALAFSLSAALIAMLAKEWLATFKASRPRPAYAHTMVHQERLNGLAAWRALHLIDVLPTLLHMSLLLFSLGLAIYLWTLDKGVAIAEVIITAGTMAFYVVTAFLGVIYPSCPFKTQISKYVEGPLLAIKSWFAVDTLSDSSQGSKPSEVGKDMELQALWWLAENARDPLVGDCVCQVLAGVSVQDFDSEKCDNGVGTLNVTTMSCDSNPHEDDSDVRELKSQGPNLDVLLPRYRLVKDLYEAVHLRIVEGQLRLPQEPDEYRGINLAQYANSLPKLAYMIERLELSIKPKNKNVQIRVVEPVGSIIATAFNTLDSIWEGAYWELSPDAYAAFSCAELRLIESAVLVRRSEPKQKRQIPSPNIATAWNSGPSYTGADDGPPCGLPKTEAFTSIEVKEHSDRDSQICLYELQARYSRVLSFVGYLLSCHNKYNMLMTPRHLMGLLESIKSLCQYSDMNPRNHMSTCFPQSNQSNKLPRFMVTIIPRVAYDSHSVEPLAIGDEDGLLAGLIEVVSSADIQDMPNVESIATSALTVVGPMLVRQWIEMMNSRPTGHISDFCSDPACVEKALEYWPAIPNQVGGAVQSTLRQLLIIATISVEIAACPEMRVLPDIALASLYRRANTLSGKAVWLDLAKTDGFDYLISRLTKQVYNNRRSLSTESLQIPIKLLLIKVQNERLIHQLCVEPDCLPYIFRSLELFNPTQAEVLQVFEVIQDLLKWPYYYAVFNRSPEGFTAIEKAITTLGLATQAQAIECAFNTIWIPISYELTRTQGSHEYDHGVIRSLIRLVELVTSAADSALSNSDRLLYLAISVVATLRLWEFPDVSFVEEFAPTLSRLYEALASETDRNDYLAEFALDLGLLVDSDTKLYFGLAELYGSEPIHEVGLDDGSGGVSD
ncbi:hypothetical protein RhiJN_24301 [Ceratobasidium sp. AG-Ba]|nr:hypothetical protein RhiJN_24301 [Ceratobasidium sp. AG-Ba]